MSTTGEAGALVLYYAPDRKIAVCEITLYYTTNPVGFQAGIRKNPAHSYNCYKGDQKPFSRSKLSEISSETLKLYIYDTPVVSPRRSERLSRQPRQSSRRLPFICGAE